MRSIVVVSVAWLLAASASRAQAPKFVYVDIQPKANENLYEGLPKGEQTLAKVKFKIGDNLIALSCDPRNDPGKADGIKVDTTCRKLYFLHACHSGTPVPDTIIGYYTVTYEDNSQETIALVHGKDIVNWWHGPNEGSPSRAQVAWKGANTKANIALYLTTWKNPEPKKKVVSIDFGATTCRYAIRPFCVAITAEK
jgi:hypothetical protein